MWISEPDEKLFCFIKVDDTDFVGRVVAAAE